MIKVGIIGATGYTGVELVRLLSGHPQAEIVALTSQSYVGQSLPEVYPSLEGYSNLICQEQNVAQVANLADVVFTALPHGLSMPVAQEVAAAGKKFIDLGADFRFDNPLIYEEWYQVEHTAPQLAPRAVYGLPEINREAVKGAQIVGNPGCFPTSAILGLAPLLKGGLIEKDTIIIDSKSGVSGAGRGLSLGSHYSEVNENFKAYNIGVHRHTPEIEQELSKLAGEKVTISFTPHLVPMTRGILSTIYSRLNSNFSTEEIIERYQEFYAGEPFIHIMPKGQYPQTKWATGSNNCYIGLTVDPRTQRVVVVAAIDNLVKGASGQAIQNMNLLFGLPETMGLSTPGMYP